MGKGGEEKKNHVYDCYCAVDSSDSSAWEILWCLLETV